MRRRQGLTLVELLVAIAVIALLTGLLLPALARHREESRRLRCRANLSQLAQGMLAYLESYGVHGEVRAYYPCPIGRCIKGSGPRTYNGAEWLASLYWTGYVTDPDVFLCPSSGDLNANGRGLGAKGVNDMAGGTFGSQTVSYAGMWWKSVDTVNGSWIRDDFAPNDPMACDDAQGSINHGTATNGGMNVVFFDGHVEFRTSAELDITTEHGSVGKRPGLLWRLKN